MLRTCQVALREIRVIFMIVTVKPMRQNLAGEPEPQVETEQYVGRLSEWMAQSVCGGTGLLA